MVHVDKVVQWQHEVVKLMSNQSSVHCSQPDEGPCAAPFPVPALPQDVERNNPALAAEFGSVMKNLKGLTTQIALLDRIHSIKVGTGHAAGYLHMLPQAACCWPASHTYEYHLGTIMSGHKQLNAGNSAVRQGTSFTVPV